jgi:hypothetical protein
VGHDVIRHALCRRRGRGCSTSRRRPDKSGLWPSTLTKPDVGRVSQACVCVPPYRVCVRHPIVCGLAACVSRLHVCTPMVCGVGLARLLQAQRTTAWSTTNGSAPKTVTSLSSRHFNPPPQTPTREKTACLHTQTTLRETFVTDSQLVCECVLLAVFHV